MSDIKSQLIKLGHAKPELQKHLRPVIAELEKAAFGDSLINEVIDRKGFAILYSEINKTSPEVAQTLRDCFSHLSESLTLPQNEQNALNRLRNLISSKFHDPGHLTNIVGKIANELKIKTNFFF